MCAVPSSLAIESSSPLSQSAGLRWSAPSGTAEIAAPYSPMSTLQEDTRTRHCLAASLSTKATTCGSPSSSLRWKRALTTAHSSKQIWLRLGSQSDDTSSGTSREKDLILSSSSDASVQFVAWFSVVMVLAKGQWG
eukprot:GHVN01098405.1.p1 GENE.GHVN01098405.1~~GHVN01098405.1.p1  ORF type:complete len:136 (-),score=10.91 GHVN01098405.1:761-1168(-)